MFGLGMPEILVILVLGLLLFGNKLPSMARTVAKGVREFQHGMKGLEEQVDPTSSLRYEPSPQEPMRAPQRVAATAPKFEDNGASQPTPPRV